MVMTPVGGGGASAARCGRTAERRRGCGHFVAQAGQPFGRTIIVPFAQDPEGNLGGGIQALQAGDVPDEVAINTCND
jgi:hypothetical protein